MSFYSSEVDQRGASVRDFCTDALPQIDPEGTLLPRFVSEVQGTGNQDMTPQERDNWLREVAIRTGTNTMAPFIVELFVIAAEDVVQRDAIQKVTGM